MRPWETSAAMAFSHSGTGQAHAHVKVYLNCVPLKLIET